MALNIPTDKETDRVLAWLAKRFKTSKAELVRSLIREKYRQTRSGFSFGALEDAADGSESNETLQADLKSIDADHDLD